MIASQAVPPTPAVGPVADCHLGWAVAHCSEGRPGGVPAPTYRDHRTELQLLCPQHALAAEGAAPMKDDQYRSLHTHPVTAKVESNTHDQP